MFLALLASACAAPSRQTPPVDLAAEEAAVNAVLDQMDQVWIDEDLDLLSRIFAHDPDMVTFGTDAAEVFVGYEPLRASMAAQIDAYSEVRLNTRNRVIHVHEGGEVAWFSQLWDFDVQAGGESVRVEGMRFSGVLEKRNGSWLFVQYHGSIPVAGQVVAY